MAEVIHNSIDNDIKMNTIEMPYKQEVIECFKMVYKMLYDFNLMRIITIPLPTSSYATMILNTISVDNELRPDKSSRKLYITGENNNIFNIEIEATEIRVLRVSINSILDLIILAMSTIVELSDV